jgi:hypothetical protein
MNDSDDEAAVSGYEQPPQQQQGLPAAVAAPYQSTLASAFAPIAVAAPLAAAPLAPTAAESAVQQKKRAEASQTAMLVKNLVRLLFARVASDTAQTAQLTAMMKDLQRQRTSGELRNIPGELLKRAEPIVGHAILKEALACVKQQFRESQTAITAAAAVRLPLSHVQVEAMAEAAEASVGSRDAVPSALDDSIKGADKKSVAGRRAQEEATAVHYFDDDDEMQALMNGAGDGRGVAPALRHVRSDDGESNVFAPRDCDKFLR